MLVVFSLPGCRGEDEARAREMCRRAEALEAKQQIREALALRREVSEEMPTAGTVAAKRCLRPVRRDMGRVRLLVRDDEKGEAKTIEGCTWAADVVEVFSKSVNPPFRRHWAGRLMAQCRTVVGRAWTRAPDSIELKELSERLRKLEDLK
jgi:hypothetical protein